jgi:hypothetical protein
VRYDLPLADGLSLSLGDAPGASDYPTGRLGKGLLLTDGGKELAGEGVGFGVPVLKRGLQTVFPGRVRPARVPATRGWGVRATFTMDLVERLSGPRGDTLTSAPLYAAKDVLAAVHRRFPALRRPLTAVSSGLRRAFGWRTAYVATASAGTVTVTYAATSAGRVHVAVDLSALRTDGLTEAVVMNEQGAPAFDRYRDSDGAALSDGDIGEWQEVGAAEARFADSAAGVYFGVRRAPPARLYRGRELVGSRLAWAGFAYVLPPGVDRFEYDIEIGRTR